MNKIELTEIDIRTKFTTALLGGCERKARIIINRVIAIFKKKQKVKAASIGSNYG